MRTCVYACVIVYVRVSALFVCVCAGVCVCEIVCVPWSFGNIHIQTSILLFAISGQVIHFSIGMYQVVTMSFSALFEKVLFFFVTFRVVKYTWKLSSV